MKESYALIDELDKMGVTVLEFAGGEPLIHKTFRKYIIMLLRKIQNFFGYKWNIIK